MAQTNYTPISLYYSTTASAVPTAANLVQGELAINTNDGKLYYEDSSGVVQVLASKAGALGDVVGPASATDNALARFDLTTGKLIQNSIGILTDAGALSGLTGLTSSGSITLSSLTSGRVTFAGASGLLTDSANLLYSGTDLTVYGVRVGRGAGAVSTNTVVGTTAGNNNSSGNLNTYVGYETGYTNSTGVANTGMGVATLYLNTGSYNTAYGRSALENNTTASYNTAVGYQAGYTQVGGVGANTFIGYQAGQVVTTGQVNTFMGFASGNVMTSGSKNVIIGGFNGNAGSLDIRTASNYIVLSDGDGNIQHSSYYGGTTALQGAIPNAGTGITFPATQSASSNANTLDDYEEGTWTPVATSQLGSITAYTSSGTYTKIGRFVYLSGIITITTGGTATGVIFIAGYPFANGSSTVTQLGSANETDLTGQAYQVRINPSLTTGFIGSLTAGGAVYTNGSSYSFSLAYST